MFIQKMMALLLLCAPIAAAYADDLAEGNGVTGSNDQFQFPKTKGEAKRYLTRRAAEGLGILPKIEYRFAPKDSTGENKRVARSLDFGAHADPRESWRKIEFRISLKDSFGDNRQAARSIEFKANADLRTSWRIEFRMAIM
jgi:hypothetical protein